MQKPFLFSLLILCLSSTVSADSFSDCRKIASDSERLACYDQLVDQLQVQNVDSNKIVLTPAASKPPQAVTARTPASEGVPVKPAIVNTSSENEFGLKKKEQESVITSTLIGEFRGWDAKTKFKLANGQVWKMANPNTRTYYLSRALDNPKVTLEKGFLGSYNLIIEGTKRKAKVKRVK